MVKSFTYLCITLLIFGNLQGLDALNPSETVLISPPEESTNFTETKASTAEAVSKLISCKWQFTLLSNGTANVHLEIELNWTGNIKYFYLDIPRTMEYRTGKNVEIKQTSIYNGRSRRGLEIYPELGENTLRTISLSFYWPLASHFYQGRWYFPAYEVLNLVPDNNIITEEMWAVVHLPPGTQTDSIEIDPEYQEAFNITPGEIPITLNVNNSHTAIYTQMPPIIYSGPPEPVGHTVTITNAEYSLIFPKIFMQNTTAMRLRIDNVSRILKDWLGRPSQLQRVTISFIPPFEAMSGDSSFAYRPKNEMIIIRGTHIFGIFDPLSDSEYELDGLRSLAYQMTYLYTPRVGFSDFFTYGIAGFGEWQCLLEHNYTSTAAKLVNEQFNSLMVDPRIWAWQWSPLQKDRGQLDKQAFHILYNLTNGGNTTHLFKDFFTKLKEGHIRFTNGLSWQDKWQLFIYYLDKATETDITSFFQYWGLHLPSYRIKFLQWSYGIILTLGLILLVRLGWSWIIQRQRTVFQGISLIAGTMLYGTYLILPYTLRWIHAQGIVEFSMVVYHSFLGALAITLVLCFPVSFVSGQFCAKIIVPYLKGLKEELT